MKQPKTYAIYSEMFKGYLHENLDEFTANEKITWLGNLSEAKKMKKKYGSTTKIILL